MGKQISIYIAGGQRIFRKGLRAILSDLTDFTVIGEAKDGRETISSVKIYCPDIILMDISLPLLNGIEATRQIKRDYSESKVVVLSAIDDEDVIRRALAAGAIGYLTKDTSSVDWIKTIQTVFKGEMVLSPVITRLVLARLFKMGRSGSTPVRCSFLQRR